jgi:hypothetical protein
MAAACGIRNRNMRKQAVAAFSGGLRQQAIYSTISPGSSEKLLIFSELLPPRRMISYLAAPGLDGS